MMPNKQITIADLNAKGYLSHQQALDITGGAATIRIDELVKRDGQLALMVLDQQEMDLIFEELHRSGLPSDAPRNEHVVLHLCWTFAESECPKGEWYDASLHSAIAAAYLLRLIQDAWGFDADKERAKEIDDFAAKLGVSTKVEGV